MALPSPLTLQIRRLQEELEAAHLARVLAEGRARGAFLAGLITGGLLAGLTGVAVGLSLGVRAIQVAARAATEEAA